MAHVFQLFHHALFCHLLLNLFVVFRSLQYTVKRSDNYNQDSHDHKAAQLKEVHDYWPDQTSNPKQPMQHQHPKFQLTVFLNLQRTHIYRHLQTTTKGGYKKHKNPLLSRLQYIRKDRHYDKQEHR